MSFKAPHRPPAPNAPSPARLAGILIDWFSRHARDLPWRRTRDPYAIWISEIMLQQTQVQTVIPYWTRWMRALPNPAALAAAPLQSVLKLWEGLGYYSRAQNLRKAAQRIVAEHGGVFPESIEAVLDLPGIGPYTAGAISSIAFGQPAPILDGNVTRVLCRVFRITGDPRAARVRARLWRLASSLVEAAAPGDPGPRTERSHLNQSLMELGATVCTPRNPLCGQCPLRDDCLALQTGVVARLPRPALRPAATRRRTAAFLIGRNGKWLVRQRPAGGVNAGLWEFPNTELPDSHTDPRPAAQALLGTDPGPLIPLGIIRHTITRYRISLETYHASDPQGPARLPGAAWLTLEELRRLPLAAAHKKILGRLERAT